MKFGNNDWANMYCILYSILYFIQYCTLIYFPHTQVKPTPQSPPNVPYMSSEVGLNYRFNSLSVEYGYMEI